MRFIECSLMMLILAIMAISCNKQVSYEDALTDNREEFDSGGALDDATFLVEIKSLNMLAIKISQLAVDTGYSSHVISFAQKINAEHQQLQEGIKELARKKDITLPDLLSDTHSDQLSLLSSADRQDFDSEFMKFIRTINGDYLSTFTNKATQAADPDIRAFAARKLDILKSHTQSISSIEQQLLDTSQ